MAKKRKKYSETDKHILYNEVDGHCPLCGVQLHLTKPSKPRANFFELAHIYPLNPSLEESIELSGEEILSDDVNDIENILAVCPNCHTSFDKPRIREEYRKWIEIKKRLLEKTRAKEQYSQFKVDDEIREITKLLAANFSEESNIPLNYKLLRISEKLNDSIFSLTKQTIKNHVVDYYYYVEHCFNTLENIKPGKFDQIGTEIKLAYLKLSEKNKEQEKVYNILIDWLDAKTNSLSRQACSIIVSFFIQNCEVFSDTSRQNY